MAFIGTTILSLASLLLFVPSISLRKTDLLGVKELLSEIEKQIQYVDKQLLFCRADRESIEDARKNVRQNTGLSERSTNVNTLNMKESMLQLTEDVLAFNVLIDRAWH
jgi:hypothetical protein